MKRDSNTYIFLYAIVMVVVVAVLLALVASGLKPAQQENVKMEKRIDILKSIGLGEALEGKGQTMVKEAYEKYIKQEPGNLRFQGSYVMFGYNLLYCYAFADSCSLIIFFISSTLLSMAIEICSNEKLFLYIFITTLSSVFSVAFSAALSSIPKLKLHIVSTSSPITSK